MIDPKFFDQLAQQLSALIPAPLRAFSQGIEKKFKITLQMMFAKLDLVTREEFDVQVALLQKARERISELEGKLKADDKKESL